MTARILVVEDDADLRSLLIEQLAAAGFAAIPAPSAEAALDLIGREDCAAVLLDNVLPGVTGLQALAMLRRRSRAPVLMMTGHYDSSFRQDAFMLGAAEVLAKPFSPARLKAAIEKALRIQHP